MDGSRGDSGWSRERTPSRFLPALVTDTCVMHVMPPLPRPCFAPSATAGHGKPTCGPACARGSASRAARAAHRALVRAEERAWTLVAWDRWVVDTFEEQAARLARSYAELGIELAVTARCGIDSVDTHADRAVR